MANYLNVGLISDGVISAVQVPLYSYATITPTLDEVLATRGHTLYVYATIEAVGSVHNGVAKQDKFCSRLMPSNYGPEYRPWLKDWPGELGEDGNLLGGRTIAGELSISIQDGDMSNPYYLTSKLRDSGQYVARVLQNAQINALDNPVTFDTDVALPVAVNDLIYMQTEVMQITGAALNTYTASRAKLGTMIRSHHNRAKIFVNNFFCKSRRIRLFVGTFESGPSEEREIGTGWYLDVKGLPAGLLSYNISGISQQKYGDRKLGRIYDHCGDYPKWISENADPIMFGSIQGTIPEAVPVALADTYQDSIFGQKQSAQLWMHNYRFAMVEEEIFAFDADPFDTGINSIGNAVFPFMRGVAGTKPSEHQSNYPAGVPVYECFVADADLADPQGNKIGSFVYEDQSIAPITGNRRTATVQTTDHPMLLTLIMMLSSADPDDNLQMINWNGNFNFATLPIGLGFGFPVADVDQNSFLDIWQRFPHWRSPFTVISKESTKHTFFSWFEDQFGWTGVTITIVNGKWTAIKPMSALQGQELVSITDTDILAERAGHVLRPAISQDQAMEYLANKVTFTFSTPSGDEASITFTEDDFKDTLGQSGYYQTEEKEIRLNAPGVRGDPRGDMPEIEARALELLLKFFLPAWRIRFSCPISFDSQFSIGKIVGLTHSKLVNKLGTRGVVNDQVIIYRKTRALSPSGVRINTEVISYGLDGKFGRIAPSARIASVVATGNPTRIVITNRFADGFVVGNYPNNDVSSFKIGQKVTLYNRDSSHFTPGVYQLITDLDVALGEIHTDGSFGGALTVGAAQAGVIIGFAERDEAGLHTTQQNIYVYAGNETQIGATGVAPWNYSEG